jgi:hypothetical protein
MQKIQSQSSRRKRRRRRDALIGGNQLATRFKRELVGDHNVLGSLPADHPRIKPTLVQLHLPPFDEEEKVL